MKNWLKRVVDILTDMDLNDDLKLRVASKLIDKSVVTWWDNINLKSNIPVTWDLFVQEFNEQYYIHFPRDQKREEFFRFKQFRRSVTKYEIELRELAEFFLELANSKEYLCSKFKEGLSLEIREKISITRSQSYKEVFQLALKAKKLTSERMSRNNFQKRKGFGFVPGQSSKKSRSFDFSRNSSGSRSGSISSAQSFWSLQLLKLGTSLSSSTFSGKTMTKRCQNCR